MDSHNSAIGLLEKNENIVEGVNFKLFAVALIYIDDIEDDNILHLDPREDIKKGAIREHFEQHLRER